MDAAVALESTVIAHGLPAPHNLDVARRCEAAVRAEGARPCTIAILKGQVRVGLRPDELRHLATAPDVRKVSLRDLPVVVARGLDGATTVAATLHLAWRAGIPVMATGGIGGVHRRADGQPAADISADLEALARIPAIVVCSGPKIILDLEATREQLETRGVTVVGYRTDTMPAFYCATSGLSVDVRCDTPEEVVALYRARLRLGLPGAVLVTVPPPDRVALPPESVLPALEQALRDAEARQLRAEALTPFLLARLRDRLGSRVLQANIALLEQNAIVAARIARVLATSAVSLP
ncbi:Pseudouridine-5'-phosphate glycosidase [Rhodothermus marinus SG0.5JP17-172]|uniref:pseudouridine-5'-phosphate glycosidase n=1 Tax=Rhodothermus marinus TaxID=29549 RepID=UPI000223D687|nr:pseudouridine-5'-phosphate glycosidase [Rhodothermus marinus]AEN73781.1 Pseudouridine-5'-phosphate glycosidase [Rhodothermus marinus SG0.5JP17-172]MBO2491566.1 pseudouridine-5'-phosphate glycosidase [Rhodothermus marinus]